MERPLDNEHRRSDMPWWACKPLTEMAPDEWEALCDGCARCCLHKLEDEDTGEILYTDIACRLLDINTCRCTRYAQRHREVPDCALMGPKHPEMLHWMPKTCAYRLLHEGRPLPAWHPLLTGDPESVHRAGISVRHLAVPEDPDRNPLDHILNGA
jgi:uncharacterized cysteine cluster protein YcgN (CxxCxxCC family)